MANQELKGEWVVSRLDGTRVGVATVALDGDGSRSGRVLMRDARTLLHTKHRLIPDPDPVLHCALDNEVVALAPHRRRLVVAATDYDESRAYWRGELRNAHPKDTAIVWTKTKSHVHDPILGWMCEHDRADQEMGPSASLVWTRSTRSKLCTVEPQSKTSLARIHKKATPSRRPAAR